MNFRFLAMAVASAAALAACGGGAGGSSGLSSSAGAPLMPIVLSAASISFLGTGAAAQTVTVSEINYGGGFFASSSTCAGIASAALAPGSTPAFVITPLGAGSCTFSIADSLGQSKALSVFVTTTTVGGT